MNDNPSTREIILALRRRREARHRQAGRPVPIQFRQPLNERVAWCIDAFWLFVVWLVFIAFLFFT